MAATGFLPASLISNILRTTVRHLWNNKAYVSINVVGLTIGVTCFVMISLYILFESSFDRYNVNSDRIYRVAMDIHSPNSTTETAAALTPLVRLLKEEFPEIQASVTVLKPGSSYMIAHGENRFYEKGFYHTDSTFFDVFSVEFVQGNPETALKDAFTVVLSESMALKYFKGVDPIGKTIRAEDTWDYRIVGVMRDLPPNSHMNYDFLAHQRESSVSFRPDERYSWDLWNCSHVYLLLTPASFPGELTSKFPEFVSRHVNPRFESENITFDLSLQPLASIHLYSNRMGELEPNGSISTVFLYGAVALLILMIACVNFVNLATAYSSGRAGEIGLRKTLGAQRGQLMAQHIGESVFIAIIALPIAWGMIEFLLPVFSSMMTASADQIDYDISVLIPALLGTSLVVGLVSGIYPALLLSSYKPIDVLKSGISRGIKKASLRQTLVVFQFTISTVLIIATCIVYQQIDYIRDKDLGYDNQRIVVIPLTFTPVVNTFAALKERLLEHHSVLSVSGSDMPPGRPPLQTTIRPITADDGGQIQVRTFWVDADYLRTLGMTMKAGRFFSRSLAAEDRRSIILNERAAAKAGWDSAEGAVGERLRWIAPRGMSASGEAAESFRTVIGVVNDFHYNSLRSEIEPLAMLVSDEFWNVSIKLGSEHYEETLAFIEETWRDINPDFAFAYYFLDEDTAQFYNEENRLITILGSFSLIAVLIACLGLTGLVSYTTRKRIREVGIRKALGATFLSLLTLQCREVVILSLIANAIAWPIAYTMMMAWIQEFEYHAVVNLGIFGLVGAFVTMIALLTVMYHTLKTTLSDPVHSLRYE